MEQQDHIATLCAAGTVGIAVTGLALGVQAEDTSAYNTTPGKRKWPGASSLRPDLVPQTPLPSRRVVSQPSTSTITATQDQSRSSRPTSLFRQRSKREVRPTTANDSDATGSRASSMNRAGFLRPRTADTRSTSERRDPSTSSSWLKRLSAVSSPRSHSPNAPLHRPGSILEQHSTSLPEKKNIMMPNKLVKRSTSQRALSNDQAKGSFLKRPATSHQRSATMQQWMPQATSVSTPVTPYLAHIHEPVWRPFFERGYSRKRPTTASSSESRSLKTIAIANTSRPALLLGSQLGPSEPSADEIKEKTPGPGVALQTMSTGRQRLRRSLSSMHRVSRRRYFTDPTVKVTTEAVNGTMSSVVKQSPLSPASPYSAFDIDLPHGSPSFPSSPPLAPVRHRFSFRKRRSTAPSDPTTASSDNDTRVFTDDDSMDFQSDTAHDSLNTRATVSSHSAFRAQKSDPVFSDTQATSNEDTDETLARLVQETNLTDNAYPTLHLQEHSRFTYDATYRNNEVDELEVLVESPANRTPVKSRSLDTEDMNATPIAPRPETSEMPFRSSPPSPVPAVVTRAFGTPELALRRRQAVEDTDDIDWSPESDTSEKLSKDVFSAEEEDEYFPRAPLPYQESGLGLFGHDDKSAEKRLSSIFDWSEHHKLGADGAAGMLARPKTVHGKQGNDGSRSRSSGRKGPPHMHLRSQSVPNNRDPNTEQPPLSSNKFGTWGLGHKPVSEEWSDDFEFDDAEESISPQVSSGSLRPSEKGTQRGVKVPQAIIDRQASVHIQFGQVQEFMLLVEELKQLRARGAALHLLESHSKQLWEDAESIIDLATINNEEDDEPVRLDSPLPSETFVDEISVLSRHGLDKTAVEEVKKSSFTPRSVSSPATPPQGRARGESLAQAKNFLQTIHQSRAGYDSSPLEFDHNPQRKLPFDTQDLKDLVVRSGVITRALKEIVRKAEGLSASPEKTPPRSREPAFSQIFHAPDSSPCPPFRKPGLPKSRSANSYLLGAYGSSNGSASAPQIPTALVL